MTAADFTASQDAKKPRGPIRPRTIEAISLFVIDSAAVRSLMQVIRRGSFVCINGDLRQLECGKEYAGRPGLKIAGT
jgi:hypothetical protein